MRCTFLIWWRAFPEIITKESWNFLYKLPCFPSYCHHIHFLTCACCVLQVSANRKKTIRGTSCSNTVTRAPLIVRHSVLRSSTRVINFIICCFFSKSACMFLWKQLLTFLLCLCILDFGHAFQYEWILNKWVCTERAVFARSGSFSQRASLGNWSPQVL